MVHSLIETAKENDPDPQAYLAFLFEKLPNINLRDDAALDRLLPWSESIPAACRLIRKTAE